MVLFSLFTFCFSAPDMAHTIHELEHGFVVHHADGTRFPAEGRPSLLYKDALIRRKAAHHLDDLELNGGGFRGDLNSQERPKITALGARQACLATSWPCEHGYDSAPAC